MAKIQKYSEKTKLTHQSLDSQFYNYDLDHSGTLDHREFRMCLQALKLELTSEEIDNLIFLADQNGDGQISYSEFINVLKVQQTQRESTDRPDLKSTSLFEK